MSTDDEVARSQASLMLRAPELLRMLKRLVQAGSPCMDGHKYPLNDRVLRQASELIDDIEGNEPESQAN